MSRRRAPRIEAIRIVDMSSSNSWAEFAALFRNTRTAFLDHERAKTELKALMPEDAKEAIGHGVRAKRSKSGAVSFDLLEAEASMHRSSESVAALAAALAKAQAELVNPEKSLTAVIRSTRPGERERTFRYAPLASGLDIVRKTLGSTRLPPCRPPRSTSASGMINLTTMLAHASGEWIASDWPVCAVAEMANPQRMGTALTYARRYALFTLVGIAGEDDLDCPDLQDDIGSAPGSSGGEAVEAMPHRRPARKQGNGPLPGASKRSRPPLLAPEQSAALRDKLVAELESLKSIDAVFAWAKTALTDKNSLVAGDAKLVEDAFEQKLQELAAEPASAMSVMPSGCWRGFDGRQPLPLKEEQHREPRQARPIG